MTKCDKNKKNKFTRNLKTEMDLDEEAQPFFFHVIKIISLFIHYLRDIG